MKILHDPAYGGEVLQHNDGSMCFVISRRGETLGRKWVACRVGKYNGSGKENFGSTYVFNFFEFKPLETFEVKIGMDFDSDLIAFMNKTWGKR